MTGMGTKKEWNVRISPKTETTYRCGGKPVIAGHLSPTEVLKNEVVVQRTTGGRNIESGRNLSKD